MSNGQYENLEDLRKAISDNILESKERRIRDELREKVVDAVIDQAQITLHPLLIKEEAEEMLRQLSHLLEQQRMSIDQYLLMMHKTRDEYLKEMEPEAEKRVRRELVLDEVVSEEKTSVSPEEVEAIFRAYEQAGQPLGRSDAEIRALAVNLRREKAITRLIKLTTDTGSETEAAEEEAGEVEASIENAGAAALAAEALNAEAEDAHSQAEEFRRACNRWHFHGCCRIKM